MLVSRWHTEHFADHRDRQRQRELFDQIGGRAEPFDRGQALVHDLLRARAQQFDAAAGERLGHQLAQPAVLGRVHAEQRIAARGFGSGPRDVLALHRRAAAEALVGEHEFDVLVAGDQPARTAVGQLDAGDRLLAAQLRVERVDIETERLTEGVSANLGTRGHELSLSRRRHWAM